jgi:SAM-dependent methyltransferase
MIDDTIIAKTQDHYHSSFERVFPPGTDFRKLAEELLSEAKAIEELTRLSEICRVGLSQKKILEIGSGYGMVLAMGRKRFNAEMFGLEPSEQFQGAFSVCRELLIQYNLSPQIIKKGVGENIPYEDNQFDIVYSSNVLEHVQNPGKVIAEAIRVLKPGGISVFIVPNYGSWWEGHYGFYILPHSPRWAISLLARMRGRDPAFARTLQLITYKRFMQWVKPLGNTIAILGTGQGLWEKRVRTMQFSEWALLSRIKRVIVWIHRFGLTEMILGLGKKLHWETPFVFTVKKNF